MEKGFINTENKPSNDLLCLLAVGELLFPPSKGA